MTTTARLPAAERRRELIEAAIRAFTEGSYRGTTTAEIAQAAGVSEPILYRHFASKRDLYLAVLDHVEQQALETWGTMLSDPAGALREQGLLKVRDCKFLLAELWAQALTEAADDPELREHLRRHMRGLHDFVADSIRRGQENGAIAADRDADAEAWMFISGGMLGLIGRRLGVPTDEDLEGVRAARLRWLTGPA